LELSLVKDFHHNFFFGHFAERGLHVLLFCEFTLLNINEYFVDLKYFIQIVFLLCTPVQNLVLVASKFESFAAFLEADHLHVGEQFNVLRGLNHF